ncbi:MAG: tetratricopeptide repeat protein [Desulfococcaceae bacterium]
MKIFIRIDSEAQENRRRVYVDDLVSHHLTDEELLTVQKEAGKAFWKSDPNAGAEIGARLFAMLNGSGRKLEDLVNAAYRSGESLDLYLNIPYEFSALPFELLHYKGFLLQNPHPQIHIIRHISGRNRGKQAQPEKRPLQILFMACSPTDLHAHQVLQFEKEEERIFSATEKLADIVIEDSGSLAGLSDALIEGGGRYDMVHITGHANIEHGIGPVFYMEDDIGRLDKVTPERLWERLRDFPPRVLFLSGCMTGKSDKVSGAESFAFQMNEKGIPLVLGWGLPVSDPAASAMTAELFRSLSMGKSLTEAVHVSRQAMKKMYHPWPLLRIFADGTPLTPLIAPGQILRHYTQRKAVYRHLADSHVQVLEKGFVGRRREIQKGVRVLKGIPEANEPPAYGLVIRGPAGIGKSCLAGKLLERFADHDHKQDMIVMHENITAPEFMEKLLDLFDRKGNAEGLRILRDKDREFADKIKALFLKAFDDLPLILYFDNFEDNLEQAREPFVLTAQSLEVLAPVLAAYDRSRGKVKLMISTRFPFVLEINGRNLADKLTDIPLASFQDADLDKKIAELPRISQSAHKNLYLNIAGGNPRLLDWLEKIAADEAKYDLKEMEDLSQKKREELIGYLADILKKAEGTDFSSFLHRAAVFRRPVTADAFETFGNQNLLDRAVNLTLMEKEISPGQDARYWVLPVIREQQWEKLNPAEQKDMHSTAFAWYDREIEAVESPPMAWLEQAVHHALAAGQIRHACDHAIDLGKMMTDMQLYRQRVEMQQQVVDHITEAVIADAVAEKDGNVSVLLGNLGAAFRIMGDYTNLIKWTEKALEIGIKTYGENRSLISTVSNNLGEAYRTLGDYGKAIKYFERALNILRKDLGENHTRVAVSYNNLGLTYKSLGQYGRAIEYYQKALDIDRKYFGENHFQVAIYNNNLGTAYNELGEYGKAIEYVERALVIDLKNFGENHPAVAREYNNLGLTYHSLDEYGRAIEYFEMALDIDRKYFGENYPNVAIYNNNLGLAYHSLDEYGKAIEYFEQALKIAIPLLGNDHPNTKIFRNNLEVARKKGKSSDSLITRMKRIFGL